MRKILVSLFVVAALGLAGGVLVQAPPALAIWLVDHHVGYFEKPYPEWAKGKSLFERLFVRAVAYKLGRDWVTRTVRTVRAESPEGVRATVEATRKALNRVFANQRQVRYTAIDLPTYARLVFGLAWCDGQNHLFALLLAQLFDEVHTFALYDSRTKLSVHLAVQLEIKGVPVFVDAWSDVPIFVMDKYRSRVESDIPAWSEVNGKVKLERLEGAPTDMVAMGRRLYDDGERRIHVRAMPLPFGWLGHWDDEDVHPDGSDSPFQKYLKARTYHIFGHFESARRYYKAALAAPGLDPRLAKAARWFLAKAK